MTNDHDHHEHHQHHDHHHHQKGFDEEEAVKRAGKVFESLDKNNDGGLAEDEFVKVHSSTDIRHCVAGMVSTHHHLSP